MGWKDWSFKVKSALILIVLQGTLIIIGLSCNRPSCSIIFSYIRYTIIFPFISSWALCGAEGASNFCIYSSTIIFTLIQVFLIWLVIFGIYKLIKSRKQNAN